MKEKPIPFSGEMVRAILDGRKTQTRRVNDIHKAWLNAPSTREHLNHPKALATCHYGQPGDRLWVKETHYLWGRWVKNGKTKSGKQAWRFKRSGRSVTFDKNDFEEFSKGRETRHNGWCKRPSIFMPRWASRIKLEIFNVRVERVQEISEVDATAEGMDGVQWDESSEGYRGSNVAAFYKLWDSLNAKPKPIYERINGRRKIVSYEAYPWSNESFDAQGKHFAKARETGKWRGKPLAVVANPWLWVIEFKVVA